MKLKHSIGLILTFCTITYGWAASNLYVQLTSGEIVYFKLHHRPLITYSTDALSITSDSNYSNAISLKHIHRITYDYQDITNLSDIPFTKGPISIFTISGQIVKTINQISDLDNINIPNGVYILQQDNLTKKILKK